jgi:hypothetical protein
MATQTIDVPLPDSLQSVLQTPVCVKLPKPGKVKITLPFGGATLQAFGDVSKGIPDDCSLSFSLALQIAPMLANMQCLIEVLNCVKPLISLLQAVPSGDLIKIGSAIGELLPAVKKVGDCVIGFFAGVPVFLRDLLALIAKLLTCIAQQLRSILNVMSGLALQIKSAQSEGNTELLATLQCAQDNAQASAALSMSAIEPLTVLLSLAEPLMGLAGVDPIKTPPIGSDSSLQGLQTVVTVIEDLAKTLRTIADSLGADES